MSDPNEQELRPDNDARLARCAGIWESERNMTSPNEQLLAAIKDRGFGDKRTRFGHGILTADHWVRTLQECVGIDACYKFAVTRQTSFDDVMRKAAKTLTYRNEDMNLIETELTKVSGVSIKELDLPDGTTIELPKNWLLVFRHTLTTPRKDRDGDILRTQGMQVDPRLPLLWQHVHTLPIGKMLAIVTHTEKTLDLISCVIDANDLCHDAAVMIDNKVTAFSHGFRALEFEALKEDEGELTGPGGFDIIKAEIMEQSAVSVPSNTDATHDETLLSLADGGKLTSGLLKAQAKSIRAARPIIVPVEIDLSVTVKTRTEESGDANEPGNGTAAAGTNGKGPCGCAPEKTDDGSGGTKTPDAEDTQVKRTSGPLEGSWEWIEHRLFHQAGRFLALTGAVSIHNRFAWLAGTFADHAIICSESQDSGGPDEFLYFKVAWTIVDGEPMFNGSPEPVDIVTTAEVRERSPLFEAKLPGDKAGRVLSRTNLAKLKSVHADLTELIDKEDDMSRGGKAICESCVLKLSEIITAATGDDETSMVADVKEAMATVLAHATGEQRKHLKDAMAALDTVLLRNQRTEEFCAFVGRR